MKLKATLTLLAALAAPSAMASSVCIVTVNNAGVLESCDGQNVNANETGIVLNDLSADLKGLLDKGYQIQSTVVTSGTVLVYTLVHS
jgi:hypothetical protein